LISYMISTVLEKIEQITIDQFIAGASSLAALATAWATFNTVREIAKQRKEAIKPDLISERQYAYIYTELLASCLRHIWSKAKLEHSQMLQHSSYAISVINIGTGTAKQINSKWLVDVSTMVTNVNVLARKATISVSAEMVPGESEIRILWPDKVIGHQLVANQLEQVLGHLLPATISNSGLQIYIPSAYLTLISLQVALGLAAGLTFSSANEWLQLPPAYLVLQYVDVNGELHAKKFQLVINLLSAGHEKLAHIDGQLPTFMQFLLNLDEEP
jgi:hypothetical protein